LIGADASHAWVSAYLPSALCPALKAQAPGIWVDFDPTNDRWGWGSPGEDYVTLAIGRDFADVSPMRGVIQGGAQHTLQVGVTVAPPEEFEQLMSSARRTP
jgi:transglutaminase-like putative cysteine protease